MKLVATGEKRIRKKWINKNKTILRSVQFAMCTAIKIKLPTRPHTILVHPFSYSAYIVAWLHFPILFGSFNDSFNALKEIVGMCDILENSNK